MPDLETLLRDTKPAPDPAWTLKLDHEIGSIECGKRADFCVLEDDPLTVDPKALKDVRVWGTVLSGVAFEAGGAR